MEEGTAQFCLPCDAEQIPSQPEQHSLCQTESREQSSKPKKKLAFQAGGITLLPKISSVLKWILFFKPEDFSAKLSLGKKEIIKEIRNEQKALR